MSINRGTWRRASPWSRVNGYALDFPRNVSATLRRARVRQVVRQVVLCWLPPLVWMGLIFLFSAQPDLPHAPGPWLDVLLKKGGHAASYGVLAWLYFRVLRQRSAQGHAQVAVRFVSAGLAVVYGLSDEYHQTLVPGRDGNLLDVAIDGAGACTAMLLDWWLARRRAAARRTPVAR
jgi:VanZ family protein